MNTIEIQNICTLAAHLAFKWATSTAPAAKYMTAAFCAQTAVKLANLGRRARRNAERECSEEAYSNSGRFMPLQTILQAKANELLTPYGLKADVGGDPRGFCLHILGLPGNTMGGDEAGFGV